MRNFWQLDQFVALVTSLAASAWCSGSKLIVKYVMYDLVLIVKSQSCINN